MWAQWLPEACPARLAGSPGSECELLFQLMGGGGCSESTCAPALRGEEGGRALCFVAGIRLRAKALPSLQSPLTPLKALWQFQAAGGPGAEGPEEPRKPPRELFS